MGDHHVVCPRRDADLVVDQQLALGGVRHVVFCDDLARLVIDGVAGASPDGGAGQQIFLTLFDGDGGTGLTLAGRGLHQSAVGVEVGAVPEAGGEQLGLFGGKSQSPTPGILSNTVHAPAPGY